MDKILVIVLILSLSSETLAWKNWNLKNSLETTEHCLEENEIAVGFLNYFRNQNPVNLTMDFFEICLNSPDPIRCVGIWNIFGYHIAKLIQDGPDGLLLVDFEEEICDIFEKWGSVDPTRPLVCLYCQASHFELFANMFTNQLLKTDFVLEFFSKIDHLPEDENLWRSSLEKFLDKHSAGLCSYACPSSL